VSLWIYHAASEAEAVNGIMISRFRNEFPLTRLTDDYMARKMSIIVLYNIRIFGYS